MPDRRIAAVVVLYHPQKEVWRNIETYREAAERLYLIDNSGGDSLIPKNLLQMQKVELLHSGENLGIAKALNLALKSARDAGYAWLLTMDQDTAFSRGDLERFLHDFRHCTCHNAAILSPLHNRREIHSEEEGSFVQKTYVMTSANLVHIEKVMAAGGYDEKLFIDEVDHELSFRLGGLGYTIWVHSGIAVKHSLGTRYRKKVLYPAERLYYMIRNYLYVRKKYLSCAPSFFQTRDRYLLRFFLRQTVYGRERLQNLKMIFLGIWDYGRGSLGKRNHVL